MCLFCVCLCVCVFVLSSISLLSLLTHAHVCTKDKNGNVCCNATDCEPQSQNYVECVLLLPVTETYTRGTTAVHSQWSCTVTPNQNQVRTVTQVEPGRERGRIAEQHCRQNPRQNVRATHTLGMFNMKV